MRIGLITPPSISLLDERVFMTRAAPHPAEKDACRLTPSILRASVKVPA